MDDISRIRLIEKEFKIKLHYVDPGKIDKKLHLGHNVIGAQHYCMENGYVTGLALDYLPSHSLPEGILHEFYRLQYLSLVSAKLDRSFDWEGWEDLLFLDISNNLIESLSHLQPLKKLRSLNCSNNHLVDLKGIEKLETLSNLDLSNCNITGLEYLGDIQSLTDLRLKNCNIKESSVLLNLLSLKSIDLSNTSLPDYSFLPIFSQLERLDIDSVGGTFNFLPELTRLTDLSIQNNFLVDAYCLKGRSNLKSLNISNNRFTDAFVIHEKVGLTTLKAANNRLTDTAFLYELKNLETIDLSGNKLRNISLLKDFKKIQSAHFSNCGLNSRSKEIEFIRELPAIEELNISQNDREDISFLKEIKTLRKLDVSHNKITDGSAFKALTELTHLNISHNNISDISFLKELKSLRSLSATSNGLKNLSLLKDNQKLVYLDLSNNNISSLGFLKEMHKLVSLDLSNNKIQDISVLSGLKNIAELYLGYNKILSAEALKETYPLVILDLKYNDLKNIGFCKDLKSLCAIDLRKNNISYLPDFGNEQFLHFSVDEDQFLLGSMLLKGNPLETPPPQIIRQGTQSIRHYYDQILEQGGTEILYEAKILIVGEGGSGKTTLFKKLQDPTLLLPDTSSTLGVDVKERHKIPHPEKEDVVITANLWDFGGQEIQYQLHQYFITPDSLYILVADNRKEHTRWDYWFQIIRLLGGYCPVLVVMNNNKSVTTESTFLRDEYRQNFSQLTIKDVSVDFGVNDYRWDFLQNTIRQEVATLPLINKSVPKLWKLLRGELENEKQSANYITITRFKDICTKIKLDREEFILQALDYFNRIGVLLHFEKDINLKDILFLNPNWITKGLYSALNNKNSQIINGCFSKEWINEFWENHENKYSFEDRTYLLRLMLKDNFDICYTLDERNYMVPMLLPDQKPTYNFDYSENLNFRFQYPFMPEGIISRLIVRLYPYLSNNFVWRKGAIFEDKSSGCTAEVTQNYNADSGLKYIGILVSGKVLNERKDFLSKIRNEVEHIHKTSFNQIRYSEMVVCNCVKCRQIKTPNFYTLDSLKNLISKQISDKQCDLSGEDVSISSLIGAVYPSRELESKIRAKEIKFIEMTKSQMNDRKMSGTKTALSVLCVCAFLIIGMVILFDYLKIDLIWFVSSLIFIILLLPTVWSYAVSPDEISEKGTLQSFDRILRSLNIFKGVLDRFKGK